MTTPVRSSLVVTALGLFVLELFIVLWSLEPPAPKGDDAPADEFSADRALGHLGYLLAENVPHPVGSPENAVIRDRIISTLESFGYEVQLQKSYSCGERFGTCAPIENILTRLPGRSDEPAVLLVSHYDSVAAAPGAADDGSAVAATLEVARILSQGERLRRPVIFLISDGEEAGLLGAEAFVDAHPWVTEVGVAVNLEARGSSGPSLMFETSEDNAWLIEAYARGVTRPFTGSLYFEIYRRLPNDTDFSIFKREGIPGLNFAFIRDVVHYHTPLDDLDHLNAASLQHHGDNALAMVRVLAELEELGSPGGNAAYLDLLSRMVVIWSEAWTRPLAMLALLVLLALIARQIRLGHASFRRLGAGLLAWIGIVLLSLGLGLLLPWFVAGLAGVGRPWTAHPWPMRLAVWSSAFFAATLVAAWIVPRIGRWASALAIWLGWSVVAVALAWSLSGSAIVILVPSAIAVLAFGVASLPRLAESGAAREIAMILTLLGAGLIALPNAILMEDALGLGGAIAICLFLVLLTAPLATILAGTKRRGAVWAAPISSGALMVLSAAVATVVTPFSADRPQQVNIMHFEDRDTGQAQWIAGGEAGGTRYLPESLAKAGGFSLSDATPLPWLRPDRSLFVAPAASTTHASPDLARLSDRIVGDERIVDAQLEPNEEDCTIFLLIPREAGLIGLEVAGQTVSRTREYAVLNAAYELFSFIQVPESGLALRFRLSAPLSSTDRAEIMLVKVLSGLPDGGELLEAARGSKAVPVRVGDTTMISRRVRL